MAASDDKASAGSRGDYRLPEALASRLIRVEPDNLVERPWGGDWIRRFKRLPAAAGPHSAWGEAFEISAFDDDDEARRYPSRVRLADGSRIALPDLLAAEGPAILGASFVARHGARFPLLPKTLDVKELLSVQGHPPGHTEVYIIIDAEPGATLRLGFAEDIDAVDLDRRLNRGLAQQGELLSHLEPATDPATVQDFVAPWLAGRQLDTTPLAEWIGAAFPRCRGNAIALLMELKALYWHVLDSMNTIRVEPGQVIFNATPARLLPDGKAEASAEVHALGNPEGREILALEIRRPGPTFRAWDNVRFPQREVDVAAAIGALNLRATAPEEFLVEPRPVPGREGAFVSVDCPQFRVEHLGPVAGRPVTVPAAGPHTLHCLAGRIEAFTGDGRPIGGLQAGESALVPVGVGEYRIEAQSPAHAVCVTLPES